MNLCQDYSLLYKKLNALTVATPQSSDIHAAEQTIDPQIVDLIILAPLIERPLIVDLLSSMPSL